MRKQILASAVLAGLAASMTANADTTIAENTTVGGKAFIDITNIEQKNDGAKTANSGSGIDVKRFYLIVNHVFDDMWSANLTTDFNYISDPNNPGENETQLFVKKAYLQAKFSDALFVRAGSADLPWVPYVEDLYGYRYVEKVLVDRISFGTSADWGVHAGGKFASGMVNYAASVVNGNGYKNTSRSNSVDVEARIGFVPVTGLTLAVGLYNGKRGQDLATATAPATRNAERWDAVVAYVMPDVFRVGAEFFSADNWNRVNKVANPATDKSDGYSFWGSYNFTKEFSAFARYDQVKPSKDLNDALKEKYFNVGVAYKPRKNIDLAFAYKNDKVENGSFKTGDATIGSPTGIEGKYDEVGVWIQVAF